MNYFELPKSTNVNRFIPKNSFDTFLNSSQKKKLTEVVEKITWLNKLSKDTINLDGTEIKEIQVFELKLRTKEKIQSLLNLIDKAIPYHIIFLVSFNDELYLSTSKKHSHINNENSAVIDWNFVSEWHSKSKKEFFLNLKENIDFIFSDFCSQLSGFQSRSISEIIQNDSAKTKIKKQIEDLEIRMKKEKQFNIKLEMNQKLKDLNDVFKNFN
jgi:hypothetical protein